MRHAVGTLLVGLAVASVPARAFATSIIYSNLTVTNEMAAASRPVTPGRFEIEAADDFFVAGTASISEVRFIGLIPSVAALDLGATDLEFYQIFPADSDTTRQPNVPTRTNSPADNAFASRTGGDLGPTTVSVLGTFTANNSVQPGSIHPQPNQTTGGSGPITGDEVLFDIMLATPLTLGSGHYFFVPQIATTVGDFYWLSAARPITAGTPFPSGVTDLQAWTRDQFLDPDWLRIGTDIVGGTRPPTFNMAFELDGTVTSSPEVPEPMSVVLLGSGLAAAALRNRTKRIRQ